MTSWLELKIRRYEHMRWAQEPDRRTLPFSWGLEHIGGKAGEADPCGFLGCFVEGTLSRSTEWYGAKPIGDYAIQDDVLTFKSAIESPWCENNRVYGQLFCGRRKGPAVVVLAQWNARWEEQQDVCRWLNRLGITAIKMSLPYHDRRAIPGHPRADHLVGPNIGLTLQANQQAVNDVRHTLRWLESEGYSPLGILGTSIGSCIGFIAMCHEPALRAGAFLHVSTYFGDVVANGLTTMNVWESMRTRLSPDDLRHFWSPISPFPYISKLNGSGQKMLAITGRYDPTFWPEFTNELLGQLRHNGVPFQNLSLPCGHYSMGSMPFKYAAGYRFGRFLSRALR